MFTLKVSIGLLAILFSAYFFVTFSSCCESWWWLDIALHFLGGFSTALFFIFVFQNTYKKTSKLFFVFLILGGVVLLGVLWEFFEWFLDYFQILSVISQPSLNDTMADFAMDLLGAVGALSIFIRKGRNKNI